MRLYLSLLPDTVVSMADSRGFVACGLGHANFLPGWRFVFVVGAGVLALLSACTNALPTQPVNVEQEKASPANANDLPEDQGDDELPSMSRPPRPTTPFTASPARLRRLLQSQYRNAVASLLGPQAASVTAAPVDVPLNGSIAVGAGTLEIAPSAVEDYERTALAAAAAAMSDASSPVHAYCRPSGPDDVLCWQELAARLGRRAFRRTLLADEVTRYATLGQQAANAYADVDDVDAVGQGMQFLFAAFLQSPFFVYLVESGELGDDPAARRLTGAELAARLSFFLTGAPPDDDLLDAGERGDLSSPAVLEATSRALLADPRAPEALRGFFSEKLQLADLPTVTRADPQLTPSLRAALVEETLRFIDDVVWTQNADVRALFESTDTFVNDELAAYYGFPLPGGGATFVKVATPPAQGRAGLLTRGAFLTRFAHPDRSSPTLRGKFIREQLLCAAVPAPPPGVATTLPEGETDGLPRTTRDRIEAHATTESCAGCHAYIDPLGYPFENFDQTGRFRTHEHGLPIDASGGIDGWPSDDAAGFMALLQRRSEVLSCLVRGLYRHAVGRLEEAGQEQALYDVDTAFFDQGLRLQDAMVALTTSDAFRFVSMQETE
jgi:hypothetical protein